MNHEPPLNEKPESEGIAEEREEQARQLLAFTLANACQHAIQAISMIASDDNMPDEQMTWGYAQAQILAIEKAVQDVKILAKTWTTVSAEQIYWARTLRKEDRDE